MRRVAVTGMGIVSCIGNNTQEVLSNLREGKSGISKSEEHVNLGFRSQIYGKPDLDPEEYLDKKGFNGINGFKWIQRNSLSAFHCF